MRLLYSFLLCCLIGLAFSSCSKKILVIEASTEPCVVPENSYAYDSLIAVSVQKKDFDLPDCDTILKKRFSTRSINIAKDMQILPLLCKLYTLEQNNKSENNLLGVKTELQQRVLVALTDLNSLQAEITCERERIQEVYDHLSGWITKRINRATVYSIIVGGLTTVIAGTIAIKGSEEVPYYEQGIGMFGAAAGTYYGFRSLAVHKKIKLEHPRNYLTDIWNKESQSRIYTPYIWNYLTKTFYRKGQVTSGLDEVLNKWKSLGLFPESGDKHYEEDKKLFFGTGGDYTQENLEKRQKMFEILMDEVITINYDLNRLMEEIVLGAKP